MPSGPHHARHGAQPARQADHRLRAQVEQVPQRFGLGVAGQAERRAAQQVGGGVHRAHPGQLDGEVRLPLRRQLAHGRAPGSAPGMLVEVGHAQG